MARKHLVTAEVSFLIVARNSDLSLSTFRGSRVLELLFSLQPSQHGSQPLIQVPGQRCSRKLPTQQNGQPITLEVCRARGALIQVRVDAPPPLRREPVGGQVVDLSYQFPLGNHAATSAKWGAKALRISNRARCNRLFTAVTVKPSSAATSGFVRSSTSARTKTSR